MNSTLRKVIGVSLIIASVAGLIFSFFGLVWAWSYKPAIKQQLVGSVQIYTDTLDTTAQGLAVAEQSLQTSIESTIALRATISATAMTLSATVPMIETMQNLTEKDLPNTLNATETSLAAAQESAKIIDSVLTALTSIPFISKNIYNPPVPLHVALQQVSDSMKNLPAAIDTIGKSLNTSSDNLARIKVDVELMADNVQSIHDSLVDARSVVQDYQTLVADLQSRAKDLRQRVEIWVNWGIVALTFILLWVAVTQVGLLAYGWELYQGRDRPRIMNE